MSTSEGAEVSATELDPKEEGVVSEAVQCSTEGVGVVEAGALVRENCNEEVVDCGVEERAGRGELEVIVGRDVKEREIQEGDVSRKDCEEEADGSVEVLEDTEDREVVEEEGVGAGEADGSVEEREGVEGVNGGEIRKDQMENTGDSATEGGYEEVVDKGVSVVNNVSDGNVVVEGGDVVAGEQERIGGRNVSVNDCEEEREGTEGVDGSEIREDQAGNTDADAIERGSKEHLDVGPMGQDHVGDDGGSDKGFSVLNNGSIGDAVSENGMNGGGDSNGQLLQLVNELRSQNELLKSQLESLQRSELKVEAKAAGEEGEESEDVKQLREKIKNLNRELLEERQTRSAAEEALKHLREEYFDADARAQDLSAKLAEAQQNLEREINEREVKLDTKLQRLHKRAKQRIQEIQKEKDDLEARFRDANESAERASSQQFSLQEQLERTRQQANEALKAMDADRQQMRSANNKLRDTIEELRHSLQPKENLIETLQQSLLEKEQMLKEMRGLLQTAEEKRQASLADISAKHQKNLGSLQSQLADAMSDRNKATETISSLQVLLAEKESKIAEMEAASSGEAVRLKAAVESIKGELTHLKSEHEKEKESWEAATQSLRAKLELAESNCIRAEIEAAKMRSQLDLDVSVQTQMLNTKDAEIKAATEEINRLEKEFSSYKARAHALLQKKDAELAAAKDSEQLNALESALKEAEEELSVTSMERDKALKDLQDTSAKYGKEISKRDAALSNAMQQIESIQVKLDSANTSFQSEKESWEINLQNLEDTWRRRCEVLEAQYEAISRENLKEELEELRSKYKKLKEEHDTFRNLADKMTEEKEREISTLLEENKYLHRSLESKKMLDQSDNINTAFQRPDALYSDTSALEQQILLLARQQAQREEELAQTQRHILVLQEEIEELERENRLHHQQEAILKTELRDMERMKKREGVDLTYLKNVILKLLETGEVEALLPVVGMLLQFSPDEMQRCRQTYSTTSDVSPTPGSESSGSGLNMFSRFSFS